VGPPIEGAELASALSRPLVPRAGGWSLDVDEVAWVPEADPSALELSLRVRPAADQPAQRWLLALRLSPEDIDGDVDVDSFVLTVRANLEEWWQTGGDVPGVTARRLPTA
jgi:hypothetical protein